MKVRFFYAPEEGKGGVGDKTHNKEYYEASAIMDYMKNKLGKSLESKDPEEYASFHKGLAMARLNSKSSEDYIKSREKYIQDSKYDKYIDTDELKKTLSPKEFQDYTKAASVLLKNSPRNVKGEKESGDSLPDLKYGRRLHTFPTTSSVTARNENDLSRKYSRDYSYSPDKGVTYKESGDISLKPSYID